MYRHTNQTWLAYLGAAGLLMLLSACTTLNPPVATGAAIGDTAIATQPVTGDIAPTPDEDAMVAKTAELARREAEVQAALESTYPKQALTPELMMRFLVGDIAAQRGDRTLAYDTWLDLAQRTRDPRAAQRAVELSLQTDNYDNVLKALNLLRDIAPHSLEARTEYIKFMSATNHLPEVEAEVQAWLADDEQARPGLLLGLHTLWAKRKDTKAERVSIERLTAPYLTLPESHIARAMAAQDDGDDTTALAEVDQAVVGRPDWLYAILYRAELTAARSVDDALAYLGGAIERLPKAPSLKLAEARILGDNKRYAEQLALYTRWSETEPREADFLIGRAEADLALHRYADAEQSFVRALSLGVPHADGVHYYLGTTLVEEGKFEAAREQLLQVNDPSYHTAAITHLAHVEARLGHREAALAQLANLPVDTPDDQIARIEVESQTLADLDDLDGALKKLDAGLAAHPDNTDLLYERSLINERRNDIPAAERDLRQYIAAEPDDAQGLNALGYTLANRTDRLAEAEQLIRQALAKEPGNPVILDSMGWVLVREGKARDGIDWLKRAFAAMPDAEIAAHYGEALWRDGQQSEARRVWADGRQIDPHAQVLNDTVHRLTGQ